MGRGKIEAGIVHQPTKRLPRKKLMQRENLAHEAGIWIIILLTAQHHLRT